MNTSAKYFDKAAKEFGKIKQKFMDVYAVANEEAESASNIISVQSKRLQEADQVATNCRDIVSKINSIIGE